MVALGGGAVYVGVTQGFDKGFLNYFTLGVAAIPLIGSTLSSYSTAISLSFSSCANTIGSFIAKSAANITQSAISHFHKPHIYRHLATGALVAFDYFRSRFHF